MSTVVPNSTKVEEEKKFRDCADLYKAGVHKNGVYTIQINPQETRKVGSYNILQLFEKICQYLFHFEAAIS